MPVFCLWPQERENRQWALQAIAEPTDQQSVHPSQHEVLDSIWEGSHRHDRSKDWLSVRG